MTDKRNVHGEGNYEASRQYNEATKRFVESGRVEQAAHDAAPRDAAEAAQMKQDERAALLRAKDHPPEVREPGAPEPAVEDPKSDERNPDEIEAETTASKSPAARR